MESWIKQVLVQINLLVMCTRLVHDYFIQDMCLAFLVFFFFGEQNCGHVKAAGRREQGIADNPKSLCTMKKSFWSLLMHAHAHDLYVIISQRRKRESKATRLKVQD